jgi:zinc protease
LHGPRTETGHWPWWGPTTLEELTPKLERAFRGWSAGDVPEKNLSRVDHRPGHSIYIMNRPDAVQSVIMAGHVAPPKANPDEVAIEIMNTILGGEITARINMNLREDKHWSYGASSRIWDARGQRPLFVFSPVQTDKTKESVQEILSELAGIAGERPATPEELDRAKRSRTLTMPGYWETNYAVLSSITEMVEYGLEEDHFDTLADRIRSLDLSQVNQAARRAIQPGRVIWVVVGDREVIEPGLRELDLGPIYEIEPDGNVKGQIVSNQ